MFFHLKKLVPIILALQFFSGTVSCEEKGKILFYRHPMRPSITSPTPAKDDMGMDYIPVYESEKKNEAPVEGRSPVDISEVQRNILGIRTVTVQDKMLERTVYAWGSVAHDAELYELQTEFLRADREFKEQKREAKPIWHKRPLTVREEAEIRLTSMGLSAEWIKDLEEAGVPDRRLLFHHEGNGTWVYLNVPEQDASYLRKGDMVTMRVIALPGTELVGSVEYLDAMVQENKTVRVRVLVKEISAQIKPDMSIEATLQACLGSVLAVPQSAALFTGDKTLVFVYKDGMFTPRAVMLGQKSGEYYEVKEGLVPGEEVAVDGNFLIDSESRLRTDIFSSGEGRAS